MTKSKLRNKLTLVLVPVSIVSITTMPLIASSCKKDTQADKKFLDGQVAKAKADAENKNTILAFAVKATDIKATGIDKNVTYEVSISKQDDKT